MTKNMTKRVTKKMQAKCTFYLMRKRVQLPATHPLFNVEQRCKCRQNAPFYLMTEKECKCRQMHPLFDDGKRVQMQANAPFI